MRVLVVFGVYVCMFYSAHVRVCLLLAARTTKCLLHGLTYGPHTSLTNTFRARGEPVPCLEEATAGLEPPDGKTKKRLEKIRDMVLFRYQSTGVWAAIQAAVELQEPVVVYPVKSLSNFATAADGSGVFGNAMLVKQGSTVRSLVGHVASGMMDLLQYAELLEEGGTRRRVGEDYVLTGQNNIIKFFFRPVEDRQAQGGSSQGKDKEQQKARPKKDKGGEGENGGGEGGEM